MQTLFPILQKQNKIRNGPKVWATTFFLLEMCPLPTWQNLGIGERLLGVPSRLVSPTFPCSKLLCLSFRENCNYYFSEWRGLGTFSQMSRKHSQGAEIMTGTAGEVCLWAQDSSCRDSALGSPGGVPAPGHIWML